MKKFAIMITVGLLTSHAYAVTPKETVEAFHKAITSGDKAAAIELLAPEVLIFESGYVERSRSEYANHHLDGDIAYSKGGIRKVLSQGEKMDGNLAVVWQESETTGTSKGKEIHVFGTETALLEKKGEKWTIMHIHWSSRKAK